jgi:hypothetical protein
MFERTRNGSRLVGVVALLSLLALSGCVSVTHYDDDGYYRCHGGRCYYYD